LIIVLWGQKVWQIISKGGPMHSVLKMLSVTVIVEFISCSLMALYYWRCVHVLYVCLCCAHMHTHTHAHTHTHTWYLWVDRMSFRGGGQRGGICPPWLCLHLACSHRIFKAEFLLKKLVTLCTITPYNSLKYIHTYVHSNTSSYSAPYFTHHFIFICATSLFTDAVLTGSVTVSWQTFQSMQLGNMVLSMLKVTTSG